MVRGQLVDAVAQELPQRERISDPPGDAALGVQALEVPDEEAPEVDTGRETGPTPSALVVAGTRVLDVRVERLPAEEGLKLGVEGVARGLHDGGRRDPQVGLALLLTTFAHSHA